ncbi:MAG: ABC transporter permease [Deltaproteobacteria bacterium]|nr:ABC transporter permease [Deltaproteobacteria bacterium]
MWGRQREWTIRAGSLGIVLLGWELIGQLQLMDPLFLSYPTAMWAALWQSYEVGSILSHTIITFWVGLICYVSALLTGISTGLILGRMPVIRKLIDPYLVVLYVTPTFTLLPFLLVFLGTGHMPLFVVVFGAVYSQVVINVISGAESIDPILIEAGRAYGATRIQLFWKVILPATVPHIVAASRIALGRGLVVLVFAEFYLGSSGLGFFTAWSGQTLRTEALFAAIMVLMALGLLGDGGLKFLRRRFFPWQTK